MRRRILWPQYFDCRLSRKLGRKVPRELCVDNPQIDELLEICKELGITCEEDRDALYPRSWYITQGRIIVVTDLSRMKLLRTFAQALRRLRTAKHTIEH